MASNPFAASVNGKESIIRQDLKTGLFYTIRNDGKHTPVDYSLIKDQTGSRQRLKYWRNRFGYTQAELAELIHVSSPTVVMMWENGLRHPRKEYRQRLNAELSYDIFPD